jgi:hypothetical protein
MFVRKPITEALISCRNILMGDCTNEHVLPCLEYVLAELDSIGVPSSRTIIERCAAEAVDQIKGANFVSAGRVLNLIHNLPLNEASEEQWDVDYFLSIELPTFLEHYEEIKSARLIALFVCKQLALRYFPDDS